MRIHAQLAATVALCAACGGAEVSQAPPPQQTTAVIHKRAAVTADAGPATTAKIDEGSAEPGIAPIAPAAFETFLGFAQGQRHTGIAALMPAKSPALGQREPIEMSGSDGFRYEHHLEISWDHETGELDYISVRSDKAIRYLADHGHSDANLAALWGKSMAEARAALGAPTLQADRPHARTYRYDYDSGGKRGTLTLEFSKLETPPRIRSISVHWL